MLTSNIQSHFSPISRNITNMGTTVTYCSNPNANLNSFGSGMVQNFGASNVSMQNPSNLGINAYNTGWINSGNFVPQVQFNPSYQSMQPRISAGQFNQFRSGSFLSHPSLGYNQLRGEIIVQPSVDISETTSDVVVTAHVPYINSSDMTLNVTENSVTVSGHAWTGNENILLNRTVALPTSVRSESVDASLNNNILEIRLPKIEKSVRSRTTLNQDSIQGVQSMQNVQSAQSMQNMQNTQNIQNR